MPATRPLTPLFDPRGPTLVWHALVEYIEDRINNGTYPPGSRIPGEAALAEETGAARETIRQAYRHLRQSRRIETVPGKGSFVRAHA